MILVEPMGSCELAELPGFAAPTVVGHGGALGSCRPRRARSPAIFTGRTHSTRAAGSTRSCMACGRATAAGAETVVLTNGCGGLEPRLGPRHAGADPVTTST